MHQTGMGESGNHPVPSNHENLQALGCEKNLEAQINAFIFVSLHLPISYLDFPHENDVCVEYLKDKGRTILFFDHFQFC